MELRVTPNPSMATFSPFSSSSSLHLPHHHKPPPPPPSPPPLISLFNSSTTTQYLRINHQRARTLSVVTRAGPSTSNYIFAFVLPLSLLAVTIFAASRVADKLDQKFLEEQAVNQEILDAEEEDDDYDGNATIPKEPEPAPSRTRNRPKREVEPSSTS